MRFQGQMKFIYLAFTHYMELCLMTMKDKFQNIFHYIFKLKCYESFLKQTSESSGGSDGDDSEDEYLEADLDFNDLMNRG